MPAIRIAHGFVSTKKLSEIVCRAHGIETRQALRWVQKAVIQEWILPRLHMHDKRFTDNVYNPVKNIPGLFADLNDLYIKISRVVEDQLVQPFDLNAGREWIPESVYLHPLASAVAKRATPSSSVSPANAASLDGFCGPEHYDISAADREIDR